MVPAPSPAASYAYLLRHPPWYSVSRFGGFAAARPDQRRL